MVRLYFYWFIWPTIFWSSKISKCN